MKKQIDFTQTGRLPDAQVQITRLINQSQDIR